MSTLHRTCQIQIMVDEIGATVALFQASNQVLINIRLSKHRQSAKLLFYENHQFQATI